LAYVGAFSLAFTIEFQEFYIDVIVVFGFGFGFGLVLFLVLGSRNGDDPIPAEEFMKQGFVYRSIGIHIIGVLDFCVFR